MFGEWTETDCLNYELSTMWETKLKTIHHKSYRLLVGPEQVTRPKKNPETNIMMMMNTVFWDKSIIIMERTLLPRIGCIMFMKRLLPSGM